MRTIWVIITPTAIEAYKTLPELCGVYGLKANSIRTLTHKGGKHTTKQGYTIARVSVQGTDKRGMAGRKASSMLKS